MTKVLSLSELTHLVTPDLAPTKLFGSLRIGTVVEKAIVTQVSPRCGVHLHLPDKLKAFASVRNVVLFIVWGLWHFLVYF